jgi:hypothetical protein
MILHWDSVSAPLQEWALYAGRSLKFRNVCLLGRKKQVLCGAVLAHLGARCYLACHPDDGGEVLNFYQFTALYTLCDTQGKWLPKREML